MESSILYYLLYNLFFFLAALSYFTRYSLLFYVLGVVFIALCNNSLIWTADLEWYRKLFTELDSEALIPIVVVNDFEFGVFLVLYLIKSLFGEIFYLVYIFIFGAPLYFKSFRDHLRPISLFFIAPGSFLLLNNVIRQGFAEFFLLYSLLVNQSGLSIISIAFHRSALVIYLFNLLRKYSFLLFFFFILIVILTAFGNVISQETMAAYENLDFSVFSFLLKFVVFVFPVVYALYRYTARVFDSEFLYVYGVFILFVIFLLLVNGRMADRAVFYTSVFTIVFLFKSEKLRNLTNFVVLVYFILSIVFIYLPSYSMFF